MAEIHIFSGLGSSLFRGLRKGTDQLEHLIDQMPGDANAQTHVWNKHEDVAREIIAKRNRSTLKHPIILVGHSNGVLACMEIAKTLNSRGIKVSYIAAIDPTLKSFPAADGKIDHIDEFHASRGFVAFGRRLSRGRKASVHTGANFTGKHTVHRHRAGHAGVAGLAAVHNVIGRRVRMLLN